MTFQVHCMFRMEHVRFFGDIAENFIDLSSRPVSQVLQSSILMWCLIVAVQHCEKQR